jgi:hypothetical protein
MRVLFTLAHAGLFGNHAYALVRYRVRLPNHNAPPVPPLRAAVGSLSPGAE